MPLERKIPSAFQIDFAKHLPVLFSLAQPLCGLAGLALQKRKPGLFSFKLLILNEKVAKKRAVSVPNFCTNINES
jgi:hypothetical protein